MRRTAPRLAVAAALRHGGGHRTADEVLAQLHEDDAWTRVARSTVYRALETLEGAGLVHAMRTPQAEMRFEWVADQPGHHHVTCDGCGAEVEVPLTSIAGLQREIREQSGFEVSVRHLALRGRCPGCRARIEQGQAAS
ncbi:MAG: Fur family transcriptional regulator [Chloroflexi bacterium]|nr:Fur family transcriptional regulator [Chloroflexota bacterium]MDA1240549.1 Fur family transcriptional regulator [Chloroflexota bacterium]